MKCPGCGSTLKMSGTSSKFVKCEYCGGEYVIEGLEGNTTLRRTPDWKPAPPPVRKEEKKNYTPARILFSAGILAAAAVFIAMSRKSEEEELANQLSSLEFEERIIVGYETDKDIGEGPSGLLGEMVAAAFAKEADAVTPQELSQIKWVADKNDFDYTYIGYSFENPLENPDAEITWLTYPKDIGVRYESGYEKLNLLTGLKKFETGKSLSECNLEGLQLESLTLSMPSLGAAAEAVEDASLIRELGIQNNIESLEGLALFPNVEKLSVSAASLSDISQVTAMPCLKSLTLENADGLSDFAVFGSIENLEELVLESENIKVLHFLDRVPQLKSLAISDGKLLDLNGLEVLENLEKLSVTNCGELEDMRAVEGLIGLRELTLERPHDCEEPSLSALTGLERLSLKSFRSCGFLQNLTNLESLSLQSCALPEGLDLSGLTKLTEFTCNASLDNTSFAFLNSVPSLETVNMRGIATYEDISGIFALPNLKKLDLDGAECEIAFDRIAGNASLESLSMAEITLYENVRVSGGGGILYVEQDNVLLSEHLDFLNRFPNLRQLNIAGNEIRDIGFAEGLGKLEEFDFSDNYVTELRPLTAISSLRIVNCKGNPVGNLQVLGDEVMIVSE